MFEKKEKPKEKSKEEVMLESILELQGKCDHVGKWVSLGCVTADSSFLYAMFAMGCESCGYILIKTR